MKHYDLLDNPHLLRQKAIMPGSLIDAIDAWASIPFQGEDMTGTQEDAARIRLQHALTVLDAQIAAIKSTVEADLPTSGTRQSLTMTVASVCEYLAIIDAFRYERETR